MATTEVGLQVIQKQIDHCDTIVDNIDTIVPKLYKIRQQALAQKEYINDIQSKIILDISSIDSSKVGTFGGSTSLDSTLVSSNYVTDNLFNTTNSANQRCVIQSLFKYKHEVGTSTHFTTEQIGLVDDRTTGLNLRDVVVITDTLNVLLSTSNSTPVAASTTFNNLILQSGTHSAIVPSAGESLVGAASANSYGAIDSSSNNDLPSHLISAHTVTGNVVGFGLT
tara:strand:+ start:551 stop:1222 length:672 start_codon:yes stop_codon:yes gene_type:complete